MNNYCAPGKYDSKNNTCFSFEQIVELCKAYNIYITKFSSINPGIIVDPITIKNDKSQLLYELKKRFEKVCQDELTITKQDFMNELVMEMRSDIENNTFRINGPENPIEWLNNFDIISIMKQYESSHPHFIFLGAVPADCHEIETCGLYGDIYEKIKKKHNNIGVVFNLDRSGQSGSHWVGIFIDTKKGKIYYCDSNGKPPNSSIQKFIDIFLECHYNKYGEKAEYACNSNKYQKDKSECGVYSCNFIIRMLSGESFESVINNPLTFTEINSCRNVYFYNNPSKHTPDFYKCDPTQKNI
jgi:hypothetical protein